MAPPKAIIGPRYRYFSEPPETISVRVGDLAAVPAEARASSFEPGRFIDLPSAEIFQGPTPRISLARLAELSPESFRSTSAATVPVPPAILSKGYKLIHRQELIEEVRPIVPLAAAELAEEKFAPPVAAVSEPPFEPEPAESVEPPVAVIEEPVLPEAAILPPPPFTPEPLHPPSPAIEELHQEFPAPVEAEYDPVLPDAYVPEDQAPELEPPVEAAAPILPPPPTPPPPAITRPPTNRRIFSMMPMFRRKAAEAESETAQPAPVVRPPTVRIVSATPAPGSDTPPVRRPRIELPPPKLHVTSFAPVSEPPQLQPTAVPPPPPDVPPPFVPTEDFVAAEPVEPPQIDEPVAPLPPEPVQAEIPPPPPAVLVETVHLPKSRETSVEMANHEDLQALFMTEEILSVDRVIELCGGLPGISSCVLSHGSSVIASHNVPDTIDLVSLSAHAVEMLQAMRASSAKMGIGAVPAVTIHSEKGPITFFNQEDICLLVLHKDRGFVPGVREKLQGVVSALTKSNLPRPLPSSSQSRILEG